ncbi:hypothetical protein [Mycoplana sp. MJR14]|uniref:hypothetical protein n=1 Tax=Mycoplana sp. MJR14 TaxID=3032583 RepID=UPI0023DBAD4B|nr:hypothetical protein [Mycoplana sp. MJR14]MDF1631191.1 hypothetical protein [Mycoplana sp. MJR14]
MRADDIIQDLRFAARETQRLPKIERRALLERALDAIERAQSASGTPLSVLQRARMQEIRLVASSTSITPDMLVAHAMTTAADLLEDLKN